MSPNRGRFADLTDLKPIIAALVQRRLMVELTSPGRGQAVSHNLYPPTELAEVKASLSRGAWSAAPREAASAADLPAVTIDRAAELSAEIAELRAEVGRLRDMVGELSGRLDTRGS